MYYYIFLLFFFIRHLYEKHGTKVQSNQYSCEYGSNRTCNIWNSKSSSETEYKTHVVRDHAFRSSTAIPYRKTSDSKRPSDEWNFYSASQSLATVLNDPRRPRPVCFSSFKMFLYFYNNNTNTTLFIFINVLY